MGAANPWAAKATANYVWLVSYLEEPARTPTEAAAHLAETDGSIEVSAAFVIRRAVPLLK
jgi:hypothetical protein